MRILCAFLIAGVLSSPSGAVGQALAIGDGAVEAGAHGWSVNHQLLSRRGGSATVLTTLGVRTDGTTPAVLEIACHEGENLEVSVVSTDSLATAEPQLEAPVWIRRDGGVRREVQGLLLDPRRVALDAATSRDVVDALVAEADTVDVLLFRTPHRPYRAVFPLGIAPPGIEFRDFCLR